MNPTFIKSIVESNLTALYGLVSDVEIDKIKENNTGYIIDGSFKMSFRANQFDFSMTVDKEGTIKEYEKKPKPRNQFGY